MNRGILKHRHLRFLDNIISCTLGMMSCDFFYAGSKIAIYAWLIERVHLVTAVKTTRLKTCQYKFHICLLFPYVIIFILMVRLKKSAQHIFKLRQDLTDSFPPLFHFSFSFS